MRNGKRSRYTLEFKQEAVRLVESGQSIAEVSRSLGVVEQTLFNWVKANREGKLKEVSGKTGVTAEQMGISRLRAELARVKMERDILGKATACFAKDQK
jgi:transposase